jgi:hypothetical protein
VKILWFGAQCHWLPKFRFRELPVTQVSSEPGSAGYNELLRTRILWCYINAFRNMVVRITF